MKKELSKSTFNRHVLSMLNCDTHGCMSFEDFLEQKYGKQYLRKVLKKVNEIEAKNFH